MADSDILASIQAGPDGSEAQQFGGQQGKQKYIGVPDAYAATGNVVPTKTFSDRTSRSGTVYLPGATTPQYVTGSEYRMRTLSPERIAALQGELAKAGLITPKQTFRVGVWDEVSAGAYRKVLAYANQGGIDENTALSELSFHGSTGIGGLVHGDGSAVGAGSSSLKQGHISTLTPAVTLEEQVQQSARTRLGRKLRKDEIAKFVNVYQGIEKHANSQDIAAQDAAALGSSSTVTGAPSTDVAASQFLDSNNAQEEAGVHTLGFLDVIKHMVGGA